MSYAKALGFSTTGKVLEILMYCKNCEEPIAFSPTLQELAQVSGNWLITRDGGNNFIKAEGLIEKLQCSNCGAYRRLRIGIHISGSVADCRESEDLPLDWWTVHQP